jgi:hypothetical protein
MNEAAYNAEEMDGEKGIASPTNGQNRKSTADNSPSYTGTEPWATSALRPSGRGGIFRGIAARGIEGRA